MLTEKVIIVTNNPLVEKEFKNKYDIDFVLGSTTNVYEKTRDYIHKGHELLTHPLMSSVKPNETPYRTVIITKNKGDKIDLQSLGYIEDSIHTTEKFLKNYGIPNWTEDIKADFSVIDFDLIYHSIN